MSVQFSTIDLKDILLVLVSSVVGWLTSRYFYRRQSRFKELCYSCDETRLLPTNLGVHEGFKFLFHDTELRKPVKLVLSVWNSGNTFLEPLDFAIEPPIRVLLSKGRLLSTQITKCSREVSGWSIERKASNRVDLSFKFIEPNEGIRIEAFIDSEGIEWFSPYSDLRVEAIIKGNPDGLQHSWSFSKRPSIRSRIGYSTFLLAVGLMFGTFVMDLYNTGFFNLYAVSKIAVLLLLGIVLLIGLVVPLSDMPRKGREYPTTLHDPTSS